LEASVDKRWPKFHAMFIRWINNSNSLRLPLEKDAYMLALEWGGFHNFTPQMAHLGNRVTRSLKDMKWNLGQT
jgi:hypothetical protein